MQSQAPICPYCNDDHSSLTQCDPRELKKVILKYAYDQYQDQITSREFDMEYIENRTEIFKRMIDWL